MPIRFESMDSAMVALVLSVAHAADRLTPDAREALHAQFGPEASIPGALRAARLILDTTSSSDLALLLARLIAMSADVGPTSTAELDLPIPAPANWSN